MSVLRSRQSRAKIAFVLIAALAVAGSLVVIITGRRLGEWAEEVGVAPLLLTAWLGAALYRRQYGGQRWRRRVALAMGTAGALGAVGAIIILAPWTEWPSIALVARWTALVTAGSVLWAACAVVLAWLADRQHIRVTMPGRSRHLRRSPDAE